MIFSSAILSWASWLTIRCAGVSFESVFSPLFLVGISAFSSRRLYCRAQFLSLNLKKKNKVRDLSWTNLSHWPIPWPTSFTKLFHGSRNRHPVLISIPKTVQGNNTSFKTSCHLLEYCRSQGKMFFQRPGIDRRLFQLQPLLHPGHFVNVWISQDSRTIPLKLATKTIWPPVGVRAQMTSDCR